MEYFQITPSGRAGYPIRPLGLPKEKYVYKMDKHAFDRLDSLFVAYYEPEISMEIRDVLQAPCFMVSDVLKELFSLLAPEAAFKGIQLFPADIVVKKSSDMPMPLYWVPYVEPTPCLHPEAKLYDTGIVEELVLREEAVWGKGLLKVDGLTEETWIASLGAAESILRRRPLGVGLKRVKVRE